MFVCTDGAAYQARDHRQPLHPAVREPTNLSEYSNLVDRRRILEPKALETSTSASERLKLKQQGMDRWRSDQRNPAYNKQVHHPNAPLVPLLSKYLPDLPLLASLGGDNSSQALCPQQIKLLCFMR